MNPETPLKYQTLLEFLEKLDVNEDEALKALLSAFSPCQPGALRGSWKQRKNYGTPPETRDIWLLFEKAAFRCSQCKSYHRITLDHINDDAFDSKLENFQVLCYDCNRAKTERGVKNKNLGVRVYRAAIKLYSALGRWPTDSELRSEVQVDDLSGATYMVRFLQFVYGHPRPMRFQRNSSDDKDSQTSNLL
jgi:hypothetical protein